MHQRSSIRRKATTSVGREHLTGQSADSAPAPLHALGRVLLWNLLLISVPAPGQHAVVGSNGGVRILHAGIPFVTGDSLLLMDKDWKAVARPAGDPRIRHAADSTIAVWQEGPVRLTKSVKNSPSGAEVRWKFHIAPLAAGRHVELCLKIPTAILAQFPQRGGKTHGVLHDDKGFVLDSFAGRFVLDFTGSTSSWNLDDLRNVSWARCFRLRFAPEYSPADGLDAEAVLRVRAEPSRHPAFLHLPVANFGNRGLRDEVENDGKGGWTDQGPNDLRTFSPGVHTFFGVPFEVRPPVIVLRGSERPGFPLRAGPIPVGRPLSWLYVLHTAAWKAGFRERIAEYRVHFKNGETAVVPVRFGIDVEDWWAAREPLSARLAWKGHNGITEVGLYVMRWRNPHPERPVASVEVVSRATGAVPIVLAMTGVLPGKLTTGQLALLDQAFTERPREKVDTRNWFPCRIAWKDGIIPGSALDRSALNHVPAGKFGFLRVRNGCFVFEKRPEQPVRFWGTNAALNGPFPPKEDAPGIARCLARQGVNMVRLHLYAVYDNTMIAPDGRLSPPALDRFDFFIAQLKQNGIYVYMDLNDGMLYGRLLQKKLPGSAKSLKLASLFDRDLIEAQKKLARLLFTHRNPYTDLRICDDPAVAVYEITNENSLLLTWGKVRDRLPEPYRNELERLWKQWLRRQQMPERPLPDSLGNGDAAARRFGQELQAAYYREIRDFLRTIGVKAPICGTNITFTLADLAAERGLDFTGEHAYHDHPNVRRRPMTYHNRPALAAPAWGLPVIGRLARAKLADKPVIMSEWNFCFPNDYRCEGLPYLSAFAAYQAWDGVLFYCATGSFDGGRWERFRDNPAILVHSQQTDPATWGLSPLCSLMFRRGDIAPGRRVLRIEYTPADIEANRRVLERLPFLPALVRVETTLTEQRHAPDWPFRLASGKDAAETLYARALHELGIDGASRTSVVSSDTGQIRRLVSRRVLLIDAPRAQFAVGELPRLLDGTYRGLSDMDVVCRTRFATIGAVSLDDAPLRESRRILLAAVANARNHDTDCGNGYLRKMGSAPVLAQPVIGRITLRTRDAGALAVFALDPATGRRVQAVPCRRTADTLTLDLTPEHRTIYYEIARRVSPDQR